MSLCEDICKSFRKIAPAYLVFIVNTNDLTFNKLTSFLVKYDLWYISIFITLFFHHYNVCFQAIFILFYITRHCLNVCDILISIYALLGAF